MYFFVTGAVKVLVKYQQFFKTLLLMIKDFNLDVFKLLHELTKITIGHYKIIWIVSGF